MTNNKTSQQQTFNTKWLFLCLGGVPHTEWAKEGGITRDAAGYLVTGPDLAKDGRYPNNWPLERAPYYLETSMPGLFAAGDVRHDSVKRCASAVGEGDGGHLRASLFGSLLMDQDYRGMGQKRQGWTGSFSLRSV